MCNSKLHLYPLPIHSRPHEFIYCPGRAIAALANLSHNQGLFSKRYEPTPRPGNILYMCVCPHETHSQPGILIQALHEPTPRPGTVYARELELCGR